LNNILFKICFFPFVFLFQSSVNASINNTYIIKKNLSIASIPENNSKLTHLGYNIEHVTLVEGKPEKNIILWKKNNQKSIFLNRLTDLELLDYHDKIKNDYSLSTINAYNNDGQNFFLAVWKKNSSKNEIKIISSIDELKSDKKININKLISYKKNSITYYLVVYSSKGSKFLDLNRYKLFSNFSELVKYQQQGHYLEWLDIYKESKNSYFLTLWSTVKKNQKIQRLNDYKSIHSHLINNSYSGVCLKHIVIDDSITLDSNYLLFWDYKCHDNDGMNYVDLENIDVIMNDYMEKHLINGISMAYTLNNRLVFARGFGYADVEKGILVTPETRFRIASISKPVTAAAVMKLVQENKITLDSYLLAIDCDQQEHSRCLSKNSRRGIFSAIEFTNSKHIKNDSYWYEVQIKHLLEHTTGIIPNSHLLKQVRKINGLKVLSFILLNSKNYRDNNKLKWQQKEPGSHYSYWNLGYYLLGLVIEKMTNKQYKTFVRENLLAGSGVSLYTPLEKSLQMNHLSGEMYLLNNDTGIETQYYSRKNYRKIFSDQYLNNRLAIGGWVSTPVELVKFGNNFNVDFFSKKNDLSLDIETIKDIKTAQTNKEKYAKGWIVPWPDGRRWWHSGYLTGAASFLRCEDNRGVAYKNSCVSIIRNTTLKNKKINPRLYKLASHIVDHRDKDTWPQVNYWPKYDLKTKK